MNTIFLKTENKHRPFGNLNLEWKNYLKLNCNIFTTITNEIDADRFANGWLLLNIAQM